MRDAIGRLSSAQAELVRLIHWDGFAIVEAAQILSIRPSTARTRYQRARADLKTALSGLAPEVTSTPPVNQAGRPLSNQDGPAAAVTHWTVRPSGGHHRAASQRIDLSAYPV